MDYPDHLLCSICLELLFKPISLNPCGHVFCECCLRRLFESSHSKISCPLCREVIEACQPAEEQALEVLEKYPAQLAERQLSEQIIAEPPSLWIENSRFLTTDSAEENCQEVTLYFDYNNRWRLVLWIFWLGAIGLLMVFSLNSFLKQAVHGSSPHQLPSHPHLSQNRYGLSSIIMLGRGEDVGENEGFTPSTPATATEGNLKFRSDNGKVRSDKAHNHSTAVNVGQSSGGYLLPSWFVNLKYINSFKGYAAVRLRNERSSVGIGNYSVISNKNDVV